MSAQPADLADDLTKLNVRHRTEHYALGGTVTPERFAEYGRCLEYIYKEYAKGFAELVKQADQGKRAERGAERRGTDAATAGGKSKPGGESAGTTTAPAESPRADAADARFKVIIFATDAQYDQFGRKYLGTSPEHTRGMFVPDLQLLLIRDDPDAKETYEVLFHEAFHQFIHRYVHHPPLWLNEGLATHYGTATPTASGLVFKQPRRDFFEVMQYAVSEKKAIPLEELMACGRDKFYNQDNAPGLVTSRMTLSYAESYTLVVYLLSDPQGREHLRKYVQALAKADSELEAREITRKQFPPKLLADMTPGWTRVIHQN